MYRFNNISNTDLSILIDEWIKKQEADHIQNREYSQHEIRSIKKDIMPTTC